MKNGFKKPYSLKNENTLRRFFNLFEEAQKQRKELPTTIPNFIKVLFNRKK